MNEYHGKYASNSKSRAKIYEQFALKTRREFCLKSRLEQAAKQNNMSITAYAVAAIEDALQRDGLPRPAPDARQDDNMP